MKIALVNDLLIAIEALRRVIALVPEYEIIWVARNGTEAVTKAVLNPPDVLLMDLIMPVMDGVEATRQIMQKAPCAILLVTASMGSNTAKVFEAMGYGARDVVNTPSWGLSNNQEGAQPLLLKLATMAKLIGKSPRLNRPVSEESKELNYSRDTIKSVSSPTIIPGRRLTAKLPPLVAIGASTGGPMAIARLLSGLPPTFPAAITIIQHIDQAFSRGLVDWLQEQTSLTVELAITGKSPQPGRVYVAKSDRHLIIQSDLAFAYTEKGDSSPYCPSVNVFFRSLAQLWPGPGLGILLTGMGNDGATGLALLRQQGWLTIAQDRASCVVYGMPKAAVELGAAIEVMSLDRLAIAIASGKIISQIQSTSSAYHQNLASTSPVFLRK